MLFNSLEFALFLPIVFFLYWFVFNRNLRWQNLLIVVASYIFYGWWDKTFLLLIAFTTLCSYGSGVLIDRLRITSSQNYYAKWVNVSNIVINLAILGIYKYFNFFSDSLQQAVGAVGVELSSLTLDLVLPVGISFYTFQALSYSIDVYNGKLKATNDIVSFFAYVSFFPQLVAGPIERATNLLPQFEKPRTFDYGKAVDGCRQILWGFFKKIVIADTCASKVNLVFDRWDTLPGSTLWIAAILFTIQIYCDFSGYSDIAIGTARLFGINLMRNFNFPYFSRDIAEFWRRWHISLTTWFRDYIYIPLGGSRGSKATVLRNTFIIFLVSGLWHGANWTYIAWGLYHALLFVPLLLLGINRSNKGTVAEGRSITTIKELFQMGITFLLVTVGWVIFRAENIGHAVGYISAMFDRSALSYPESVIGKDMIIFPLIFIFMVIEWLQRDKQHALQLECVRISGSIRFLIYVLFALVISIFMFGDPAEFIYFQF